jgi:hypothetical protein
MWAAIDSAGNVVGLFQREDDAARNAGDGGRHVPRPADTPRRSTWDPLAERWVPPATPEPDADREARMGYDVALDRRLIQEVTLDVVLALAEDPDFAARLRPSTRQKIALLRDAVDAVKATRPKRP